MTIHTPWTSGFRLLIVFALFALTGGASLASQGDIKDAVLGDEEPGLVDEGEYVSPQFDVNVDWTDAWAVGDESDPNVAHAIGGNYDGPVASDPDLGDIVFLVDTETETAVLSLGFSPSEGPVDPELLLQSMGQPTFLRDNLFLSSEAEVLLLEANDETAAILAREAAPNDDHVVYLTIVADPGREDYSFWVGLDMYEPEAYEAILTSMEEDIEVEDNDLFEVFGVNDILDAIEAGPAEPAEIPAEFIKPTEEPAATEGPAETIEATEEPVSTEEPTEEPVETEQPTDEPTQEPIGPVDATEEPVVTEEPTEEPVEVELATEEPDIPPFESTETQEATEASPEAPLASPAASPEASPEAPGLVAEGDYLSPQHDVPVTWTDAWTLDSDRDQPVQSFTETGIDALYLTDAASENAIVYITVENTGGEFDPEAVREALSGPDYIESYLQLSADTEVVLSESGPDSLAVMYLDSSGDAPLVAILEAHVVDDDSIVFVELRAEADDIDADLLDSVADDIAVNGEAGLRIFSTADILDALP